MEFFVENRHPGFGFCHFLARHGGRHCTGLFAFPDHFSACSLHQLMQAEKLPPNGRCQPGKPMIVLKSTKNWPQPQNKYDCKKFLRLKCFTIERIPDKLQRAKLEHNLHVEEFLTVQSRFKLIPNTYNYKFYFWFKNLIRLYEQTTPMQKSMTGEISFRN